MEIDTHNAEGGNELTGHGNMEVDTHNSEGGNELTKHGNMEVDRISRLCDTVIHHILSFLPVNDAARTSILSKRWRNIWASMPTIDFDQRCFLEKVGGALRSQPSRTLVEFMSESLLCRERAPIQLLKISLDYRPSFYYPIRQWIHLSMKFNVHEIHLDFHGGDVYVEHHSSYSNNSLKTYYCDDYCRSRHSWDYDSNETDESDVPDDPPESDDESDIAGESDLGDESDPNVDEKDSSSSDGEFGSSRFFVLPSLFTYRSLRVLQLTRCNINHEGDIGFRDLTSLALRDVVISEKKLHQILSSCSLLENLELRKIAELKHLEYSASKLRSMKLECCHYLKEVLIDAPELQHFKCGLSSTIKLLSLHFPTLMKAEIGLCHNINCNVEKRAGRLLKHLESFLHAEDLTLYSKYFEDMMIPKGDMKNFTMYKVKRFEMIGEMGSDGISAIFTFLKAFDNLESLCLTFVHPKQPQKFDSRYEEKQLRKVDAASMSSLQFHLKELKVNGFEGSDIEIKLLKFLLDNAKILENVDIKTYTPSFLTHREVKARLLNWRSSQDLKIHYD